MIARNSDRGMESGYEQMQRMVYKKVLKNKLKRHLSIKRSNAAEERARTHGVQDYDDYRDTQ